MKIKFFINNTPNVDRAIHLLGGILLTLDFIPVHQFLFDWHRIRHDLELWRIVTSFCYCGGRLNEFHALILLYLIHNHGKRYELNPFATGGG